MISYAQNREDVMLSRALRGVERGFYIDVGAAWPTEDSVTRTFYDRGWSGINVEPAGHFFEALRAARPRDVNVQAALDEAAGERTFYAFEGTGLSTLEPGVAEGHKPGGWPTTATSVHTRTLADVCAEHASGVIHFLKIDVEGAEERVLRGADFVRFRPWIVVVEATRPGSQEPNHAGWEPILAAASYEFAWFDGLNRFYLAAEKAEALRGHFRLPVNSFDQYQAYNPQIERACARADEAEAGAERVRRAAEMEVGTAREEGAAARRRAGELEAEARELRRGLAEAREDAGARVAELEARLSAFEQFPGPAEPGIGGGRPPGLRGLVVALYRATARRLVRPAMWRLRTFLLAEVRHEQRVLSGREREAAAEIATRVDGVRREQREAAAQLGASLAVLRQEQGTAFDRTGAAAAELPGRLAELQHGLLALGERQRELVAQFAARLGELQQRLDGTVGMLHGALERSASPPVIHVAAPVVDDTALRELARSMEAALMTLAVTAARGGRDGGVDAGSAGS